MSCIAYRNGVMAADSRAWATHGLPIGTKWKIERLEDGTLLGATSADVGAGEALRDWYKAGHDPDAAIGCTDGFKLLIVHPNGEAFFADGTLKLSGPLQADYFAIGTGAESALGAMAMGATAEQAVEVAISLCISCGGPVRKLSH